MTVSSSHLAQKLLRDVVHFQIIVSNGRLDSSSTSPLVHVALANTSQLARQRTELSFKRLGSRRHGFLPQPVAA